MSSPLLNPGQQKPPVVDWARLIPGETPVLAGVRKKPSQSVKTVSRKLSEIAIESAARMPENALTLLMPAPLQGRLAWKWVRSTAADFALVALNWLLIGALLVPLRRWFPHVRSFEYSAGAPVSLLGIAFLHAALITLMGYTEGLHSESGDLGRQARLLGKSVLWATAVLCFTYGLQGASWSTSGLFCGAGLLHFSALLIWRWQRVRQERRPQQREHLRNVLIIGAGGVGRRVASYVEGHPEDGRTVRGFLDNQRPLGNGVIGRVSDLARLARTGFVDEIILAAPHDRGLTQLVLRESRRLRLDLEIVPELFGCSPLGSQVERVGDSLVICLHAERLPAAGLKLKRAVDVIGAGLALTALLSLLAVIAALIKLDSAGPVLYCAPRAGRKGRLFRCYKFRTMVTDADALKERLRCDNQRAGPCFKIAGDSRITRLGRFLRRSSLDELPQLVNVLRGEMSLVGPRPTSFDASTYELWQTGRLDFRPGITGPWQVQGRNRLDFTERCRLEISFFRRRSLPRELWLLVRTIPCVLRRTGVA